MQVPPGAQSVVALHLAPRPSLARQVPPLQKKPVAQPVLVPVQVLRHMSVLVSHPNPLQGMLDVVHVPVAHVPCEVTVGEVADGHVWGEQIVVGGYFSHPPCPSHLPSVPQLDGP